MSSSIDTCDMLRVFAKGKIQTEQRKNLEPSRNCAISSCVYHFIGWLCIVSKADANDGDDEELFAWLEIAIDANTRT